MLLRGICFFLLDFNNNCFHILLSHKLFGVTDLSEISTFMHWVRFGNLLSLVKKRNKIASLRKINQSGYTSH